MTVRRLVLPIALCAAGMLASGPGALAVDVVVDFGPTSDGQVTLSPAVASWSADGEPAVFQLANGADRAAITARLSIGAPDDATGLDLGTIALSPGEVATITLGPDDLPAPLSVLHVAVDRAMTLQGFAVREGHRPAVAVEISDRGDVVASSDEPTVVSLQVRQRSWLGAVSSERLETAIRLGPGPRAIELGDRPWLPGPWWVDTLVVDHSGAETRLTIRRSDLGRDALVALGLVAVVGVAVSLAMRRRSAQPLAD